MNISPTGLNPNTAVVFHVEPAEETQCREEFEQLEFREAANDVDFADWVARWLKKDGWTQKRIVNATGKRTTRARISQLAIYGRWRATSNATTVALEKVSEGAFRGYWEQTDKHGHEHLRFAMVDRLIGEGKVPYPEKEQPAATPLPPDRRQRILGHPFHRGSVS